MNNKILLVLIYTFKLFNCSESQYILSGYNKKAEVEKEVKKQFIIAIGERLFEVRKEWNEKNEDRYITRYMSEILPNRVIALHIEGIEIEESIEEYISKLYAEAVVAVYLLGLEPKKQEYAEIYGSFFLMYPNQKSIIEKTKNKVKKFIEEEAECEKKLNLENYSENKIGYFIEKSNQVVENLKQAKEKTDSALRVVFEVEHEYKEAEKDFESKEEFYETSKKQREKNLIWLNTDGLNNRLKEIENNLKEITNKINKHQEDLDFLFKDFLMPPGFLEYYKLKSWKQTEFRKIKKKLEYEKRVKKNMIKGSNYLLEESEKKFNEAKREYEEAIDNITINITGKKIRALFALSNAIAKELRAKENVDFSIIRATSDEKSEDEYIKKIDIEIEKKVVKILTPIHLKFFPIMFKYDEFCEEIIKEVRNK